MAMANFSKEGKPQFTGTQGGLMQNLCVQHCVVQVVVWVNVMVGMFMDSPGKSCLGDQQRLQNLYAVPTVPSLPAVSKRSQIKTKLTSKVPKSMRRNFGPGLQFTYLGRKSSHWELPVSTNICKRKQCLLSPTEVWGSILMSELGQLLIFLLQFVPSW